MPGWYFEPYSATGGFTASAGRRLLEGTEMQQPETLARESLQNSCDAEDDPERPVTVQLRLLDSEQHEVPPVESLVQLAEHAGPVDRSVLQLPEPLKLLYIEDFNTVGLGGASRADIPSTPEDNFVRLCRNIGDAQEIKGRGGTFGFGKAVYWSNSSIHLVAFYSRFDETERTQGAHSRFIAAGWFKDHVFDDQRFTGRAWFGSISDSNERPAVEPLVNDEADEIADKLGFSSRQGFGKKGTSILLVGAQQIGRDFLSQLRQAVEKHYWPRILEDRLAVSFMYGDEVVETPDLDSRIDLARYYDAYLLAVGDDTAESPGFEHHIDELSYSPHSADAQDYILGRLAVVPSEGSARTSESPGVALIRAPRMVVQYYKTPAFPEINYGAVFIADSDVEDILQRSEPPAHDRWSQSSNELEAHEIKVVQNLLSKLRGSVTAYLESLVEEEAREAVVCEEVSREMGKYLNLKGAGGANGGSERLTSVHFLSQPHRMIGLDGVHRLAATVQIAVERSDLRAFKEEAEQSAEQLRVEVELLPVIDLTHHVRQRIPIEVLTDAGNLGRREDTALVFDIDGPETYEVQIVSQPLPFPELTVDLSVTAELERGEG